MQPEEIGRSYDTIAECWTEPRLQTNGIPQHERALQFAKQSGCALDIGCGCNGRIIDLLRQRGYLVEGVDVSARMITLARERNPGVTFHHADICKWTIPRRYDFISAWDSIWHVPLDLQEALMRKIYAALNEGGVFIFTTGGMDKPEEKRDSCMGVPAYYSVLGIPRTLELISECGCVCRHLEFDQHPEKHLYVIAQKGM